MRALKFAITSKSLIVFGLDCIHVGVSKVLAGLRELLSCGCMLGWRVNVCRRDVATRNGGCF